MNRRDIKWLTLVIKRHRDVSSATAEIDAITRDLASVFNTTYKRFDKKWFLKACGYQEVKK